MELFFDTNPVTILFMSIIIFCWSNRWSMIDKKTWGVLAYKKRRKYYWKTTINVPSAEALSSKFTMDIWHMYRRYFVVYTIEVNLKRSLTNFQKINYWTTYLTRGSHELRLARSPRAVGIPYSVVLCFPSLLALLTHNFSYSISSGMRERLPFPKRKTKYVDLQYIDITR